MRGGSRWKARVRAGSLLGVTIAFFLTSSVAVLAFAGYLFSRLAAGGIVAEEA